VKPRVRFLGWQDELAPVIAAADVFVYPARQEDVADAVVEAWECRAPVIAADSLGPGLLIRHRENGVLVPVGDAVSMAEAIKWVCQDRTLAAKLGEAGHAIFAENYSAEKVAPRYMDLLTRLAAAPAAS
jgi:glycosyltransferase involved in cell wall biosynthesis